jgi:hypothetical protein
VFLTPGSGQSFLSRFDIERTFRLFTRPSAADGRAWLVIGSYVERRLVRALARDLQSGNAL